MAMLLYVTARLFLYLSITRIAYIAFLWTSLRPLARKHFSKQIDGIHDVVARFVNAILDAPISSKAATGPTVHEQPEPQVSKKEM
jgi:hypothetical protein